MKQLFKIIQNRRLDKAISLKKTYAFAYNNRAMAKYKMNDLPGALSDCDASVNFDNKYVPPKTKTETASIETN